MAHVHRFHVGQVPANPTLIPLPAEEAHHALRVVRLREGDSVALFDGRGREFPGTVASCARGEVQVRVDAAREMAKPVPELTLAVAWLHQDKAIEFIVKHGTELGVARFVFFRAARSERPPKASEKWQRLAVEVCKQSGRLWLPEFEVVESLPAALDALGGLTFFGALAGPHVPLQISRGTASVNLLVGPEGDFTEEESAMARSRGALGISLGSSVFKAEMAALVGAALIQYEAGHLGPRA